MLQVNMTKHAEMLQTQSTGFRIQQLRAHILPLMQAPEMTAPRVPAAMPRHEGRSSTANKQRHGDPSTTMRLGGEGRVALEWLENRLSNRSQACGAVLDMGCQPRNVGCLIKIGTGVPPATVASVGQPPYPFFAPELRLPHLQLLLLPLQSLSHRTPRHVARSERVQPTCHWHVPGAP